jgi:hypothetical protein
MSGEEVRIDVRVWKSTIGALRPELSALHNIPAEELQIRAKDSDTVWAWRATMTRNGEVVRKFGTSRFKRSAVGASRRTLRHFQKACLPTDLINVFHEVPEEQVSKRELARAKKRLEQIERDLGASGSSSGRN